MGGIRRKMGSNVTNLTTAIDAYPAAFRGNRLNLLFLDDAQPIFSSQKFLKEVDSMELQEDRREYLIGDKDGWPFPTISIESRPDPWTITEALFNNFEIAEKVLPTQRDIGKILTEHVSKKKPDVIILNIVDGLSYYDLPDDMDAIPCLVRGVTTTDFGFRDVIGKPAISQRLFSLGYKNQLAFTFFDTDAKPLSNELHSAFGNSQLNRINSIEECIDMIRDNPFWRGYIQIVAPGLDKLAHYHPDRPMIKETLAGIFERLQKVVDSVSSKGRRVAAYLTSDHGILWRDYAKEKTKVVGDLFSEDMVHPRYINGSLPRSYARTVRLERFSYTLLKAPYMTRDWKHSEWGVHGGISAWESIVPIIIKEIG
ncbi:MAG: hypothetical protein ACP5U1_14750 [Desulfomonilaceae bacterium]